MVFLRNLTIALIVASAIAGQAEEPRVPPAGNSEKGAISEAKKSFEDLREAKAAPREQTPSSLPMLPAPELTITGGHTKPARSSQNLTPKKSQNWLVDGVLGNGRGSNDNLAPNRADSLVRDRGAVEPSDGFSTVESLTNSTGLGSSVDRTLLPNSAGKPERRPSSAPTQQSAPNPLSDFMQSWISPQDRQLLLPSEIGSGSPTPAVGAIDSNPSSAPLGPAFDRLESGRAFESKHTVRDNPYIGGLASVADPRSGQFQTQVPPASAENIFKPSANPSLNTGDATRLTPNKPAAREFGKQDDNGKYFRQLNRF